MAVSGPLRRSRSLPWPVAAGTWTWRCATAPALLAVIVAHGPYWPCSACRRRTPFASPCKKIRDLAPWPAWSLSNLSWSLLDHQRFECCPQWSLLDHRRFEHCPRWPLLSLCWSLLSHQKFQCCLLSVCWLLTMASFGPSKVPMLPFVVSFEPSMASFEPSVARIEPSMASFGP